MTLASGLNTYAGNTRRPIGHPTVGNPLALQSTVVDMNVADAGTLSFGNQSAATFGGLIGTRNINLGSTNLSIGALGTAVTSQPLYTGVLSGAGGITKIGNGNISIGGPNTYTGGTFVMAGTLTLGGLLTSAKIMTVGRLDHRRRQRAIGFGYRGFLYNNLVAGGYTNVLDVGTHNTNPGTLPASQQWHDGWGGWTIEGIESNIGPWLTSCKTAPATAGTVLRTIPGTCCPTTLL